MARQLSIIMESKEPSVGDSIKKPAAFKSKIIPNADSSEQLMEVQKLEQIGSEINEQVTWT